MDISVRLACIHIVTLLRYQAIMLSHHHTFKSSHHPSHTRIFTDPHICIFTPSLPHTSTLHVSHLTERLGLTHTHTHTYTQLTWLF